MTTTQLLLPTIQIDPEDARVPLAELPPDTALAGDPPDKRLVDSIRAVGLLHPVLLIAGTTASYTVAAGRRRIKAARAAGLEAVSARVFPAGWISPHSIALMENALRTPNLAGEYHAITALVDQGADEKAIGAATGLTAQEIRARLTLEHLIPPLKAALASGTIRSSIAAEAARLAPDHQRELAARLAERGTLTRPNVREVTRVKRSEALAALPAALFDTPAATASSAWQTEVGRLLLQARALVPGPATDLRAAIAAALATLEGSPPA